jgi:hypothetical protein
MSSVVFLSVDIVQSKRLKTEHTLAARSWLPIFRDLFTSFPLIFVGRVAGRFIDAPRVPEYRVWKVLGDEIIFASSEPEDAGRAALLAAFHDAVVAYDARNRELGGYGVKGCAWSVTLDGVNETIAIPEMASSADTAYEDVIGPDVDFGFAMARHGRAGRTILDQALAQVLNAHAAELGLGAVEHERIETPYRSDAVVTTYMVWLGDG